jgi:general secretion pathway protein A
VRAAYGWADIPGETFFARAERFLLEAHAQEIRALLIVEESQRLESDVAAEIARLVSLAQRVGGDRGSPLTVLLVGHDDFLARLDSPDNVPLKSVVKARYRLRPLTEDEVRGYVEQRLAVAEIARNLFTAPALTKIAEISHGIPRAIDVLCDAALAEASRQGVKDVGPTLVEAAAEHLTKERGGPPDRLEAAPPTVEARPPERRIRKTFSGRIAAVVVGLVLTAVPAGYMVHHGRRQAATAPPTPPPMSEPAQTPTLPADTQASAAKTRPEVEASRSEPANTAPLTTAPVEPAGSEVGNAAPRTLSAVPPRMTLPAAERRSAPLASSPARQEDPPLPAPATAAPTTSEPAAARSQVRTPTVPSATSTSPRAAAPRDQAVPAGREGGPDPTSIIDWLLRDAPRRAD